MTKKDDIKQYSEAELDALLDREGSETDWAKVDAITEDMLDRLIAEDPEERDLQWDWEAAEANLPPSKRSVRLVLDRDVVDFFKARDGDPDRRMAAVLRAFVQSHKD
jgi:uncharacterized protein (DUF4415 family)